MTCTRSYRGVSAARTQPRCRMGHGPAGGLGVRSAASAHHRRRRRARQWSPIRCARTGRPVIAPQPAGRVHLSAVGRSTGCDRQPGGRRPYRGPDPATAGRSRAQRSMRCGRGRPVARRSPDRRRRDVPTGVARRAQRSPPPSARPGPPGGRPTSPSRWPGRGAIGPGPGSSPRWRSADQLPSGRRRRPAVLPPVPRVLWLLPVLPGLLVRPVLGRRRPGAARTATVASW